MCCMEFRLLRSVCGSGCIRTKEWKKTGKVRSKWKGRKSRSRRDAHV